MFLFHPTIPNIIGKLFSVPSVPCLFERLFWHRSSSIFNSAKTCGENFSPWWLFCQLEAAANKRAAIHRHRSKSSSSKSMNKFVQRAASLTNLLTHHRQRVSSVSQITHFIQVNYNPSYLNHRKPAATKLIKRLFTHLHVWYSVKEREGCGWLVEVILQVYKACCAQNKY